MIRPSSAAFRTLWTICAVASLELTALAGMALAQDGHPLMPAANVEIDRLRGEIAPEKLERLNLALEYLVVEYDLPALYAMVKGADPDWVLARGEVEQHVATLAIARRALTFYFGSREKMEVETYGLSEAEIIEKAQALN